MPNSTPRSVHAAIQSYFAPEYNPQEDFELNSIVETSILGSSRYDDSYKMMVVTLLYLSNIPISTLINENTSLTLTLLDDGNNFKTYAKSCGLQSSCIDLAVTAISVTTRFSKGYSVATLLDALLEEFNSSKEGKLVVYSWAVLETACLFTEMTSCLRNKNFKQMYYVSSCLKVIAEFIQTVEKQFL